MGENPLAGRLTFYQIEAGAGLLSPVGALPWALTRASISEHQG